MSIFRLRIGLGVIGIGLIIVLTACGPTVSGQNAPISTPPSTPTSNLSNTEKKQIETHNNATLARVEQYVANPQKYDGDPDNAFKDFNVKNNKQVFPDGTTISNTIVNGDNVHPVKQYLTQEITVQNAPDYVTIENARFIGTLENPTTGAQQYMVLAVGHGKFMIINFSDFTAVKHNTYLYIHPTRPGTGFAGENPDYPNGYTPDEIAHIFGDTDSNGVPNHNGIDIAGMAMELTVGTSIKNVQVPDQYKTKAQEQAARGDALVNAINGHGTSPNILTAAQVKSLADGTMDPNNLPGLLYPGFGISDADSSVLSKPFN